MTFRQVEQGWSLHYFPCTTVSCQLQGASLSLEFICVRCSCALRLEGERGAALQTYLIDFPHTAVSFRLQGEKVKTYSVPLLLLFLSFPLPQSPFNCKAQG